MVFFARGEKAVIFRAFSFIYKTFYLTGVFSSFFKSKKNSILFLFFLLSVLPFSHFTLKKLYPQTSHDSKGTENEKTWALAFSEFELEDITEPYTSYAKTVPELLQYYLNTNNYRRIPLEEKKAIAVLEISQKKLKAIYELNDLILKKDKLFLLPEDLKTKAQEEKKLNAEIKKKKDEIESLEADIKIESLKANYADDNSLRKVVAWNNAELFTRDKTKSLAKDLYDRKANALITGKIKDISGYTLISVTMQTGLAKNPEITVKEAGRYEDINDTVETLATLLYANLQSLPERKINIELQPKTAKLFINDNEIFETEKTLLVYANEIDVFASAEGFEPAKNHFKFGTESTYKLSINLRRKENLDIPVSVQEGTKIFANTKELASEDNANDSKNIQLEDKKSVLEFENADGVKTFVVMDPKKLKLSDSPKKLTVKVNQKTAKSKIEKQRSIMYWSLAAVYVSLPTTLILTGFRNDKINAINSGRIPGTAANLKQVKDMNIATNVMIGITSALAVNYFVQVILYLIKADSALPKTLK